MKAHMVVPMGVIAAIGLGIALSGIIPTRMLGTGEPQELQIPQHESEPFSSTSTFAESGPYDLSPGLPSGPDGDSSEAEDLAERNAYGGYDNPVPVEMSPTDLARARANTDYVVSPDGFADTPHPFPAEAHAGDAPTATGPHRIPSAPKAAAPRSPIDTHLQDRQARMLDAIY